MQKTSFKITVTFTNIFQVSIANYKSIRKNDCTFKVLNFAARKRVLQNFEQKVTAAYSAIINYSGRSILQASSTHLSNSPVLKLSKGQGKLVVEKNTELSNVDQTVRVDEEG